MARLHQASVPAVSTLPKIIVDANAPASVGVRVADSVLDQAKQAIEIEDVEVRVAALERAAEQQKLGPLRDASGPAIAQTGPVQPRERLGGMPNYYYRAAAFVFGAADMAQTAFSMQDP